MTSDYVALLNRSKVILERKDITRNQILQEICELLYDSISYYDWVGYYFADHSTDLLHLGPFIGEPTEHTVIPFGKGICGQVALSNETFVVDDVTAQSNYIACSLTVKSEIVVPIFVQGINIGQIDIDSHTLNAFTNEDKSFLEALNKEVAKLY
ncbi:MULTISPECIES: GAF domain-containing protein [Myroides]|uniref:GAF domain-containing protein n=1 Tax=Myroides albus TaxID=2562892 RepID=A0A6I3LLD0_9FLAO|nr:MULTISPECIES: GAF domain-containing protein [Myroides]MTG98080.1 GAF domain-containing protein [Myroides albus]MVX36282.1 GAF domain-containing protein [Myroides sp. LoEW2-1]UVD80739.1 GAF domain-containing protein [Myroides albus]